MKTDPGSSLFFPKRGHGLPVPGEVASETKRPRDRLCPPKRDRAQGFFQEGGEFVAVRGYAQDLLSMHGCTGVLEDCVDWGSNLVLPHAKNML